MYVRWFIPHHRKGFLLLEVLVGIAVFAVFVGGIAYVMLNGQESTDEALDRQRCAYEAAGALEVVRTVRDKDFALVDPLDASHAVQESTTYGYRLTAGTWELFQGETVQDGYHTSLTFRHILAAKHVQVTALTTWDFGQKRQGSCTLTTELTNWKITRTFGNWTTPTVQGTWTTGGPTASAPWNFFFRWFQGSARQLTHTRPPLMDIRRMSVSLPLWNSAIPHALADSACCSTACGNSNPTGGSCYSRCTAASVACTPDPWQCSSCQTCTEGGASWNPAVSSDGRYVAFWSSDATLVPNDTNGIPDLFVYDTVTKVMTRVDVADDGSEVTDAIFGSDSSVYTRPSVSANGRYVAFTTHAPGLVANDTNGSWDVFVHDRDVNGDGVMDQPGDIKNIRVDVSTTGVEATNGVVLGPVDMTPNGRFVTFASESPNLIDGLVVFYRQIYVHDRDIDGNPAHMDQAGNTKTVLVSTPDDIVNGFGNNNSVNPSISDDGRFVTFQSTATNFDGSLDHPNYYIYVHDRDVDGNGIFDERFDGNGDGYVDPPYRTATTRLNDPLLDCSDCFAPAISGDGNWIAYGTTQNPQRLFLYKNSFPATQTIVDTQGGANPSLDTGGSTVLFERGGHLYAYHRASGTVQDVTGSSPNEEQASLADDGQHFVFASTDPNWTVPAQAGSLSDVFIGGLASSITSVTYGDCPATTPPQSSSSAVVSSASSAPAVQELPAFRDVVAIRTADGRDYAFVSSAKLPGLYIFDVNNKNEPVRVTMGFALPGNRVGGPMVLGTDGLLYVAAYDPSGVTHPVIIGCIIADPLHPSCSVYYDFEGQTTYPLSLDAAVDSAGRNLLYIGTKHTLADSSSSSSCPSGICFPDCPTCSSASSASNSNSSNGTSTSSSSDGGFIPFSSAGSAQGYVPPPVIPSVIQNAPLCRLAAPLLSWMTPKAFACGAAGVSCLVESECCNGGCILGKCISASCMNTGGDCTTDGECCTNLCDSLGHCACPDTSALQAACNAIPGRQWVSDSGCGQCQLIPSSSSSALPTSFSSSTCQYVECGGQLCCSTQCVGGGLCTVDHVKDGCDYMHEACVPDGGSPPVSDFYRCLDPAWCPLGCTQDGTGCECKTAADCSDGRQCVSGVCLCSDDAQCPSGESCGPQGRCIVGGYACVDGGACRYCGNGIVDQGEECDDGNQVDSDGCARCKRILPPGPEFWVVDPGTHHALDTMDFDGDINGVSVDAADGRAMLATSNDIREYAVVNISDSTNIFPSTPPGTDLNALPDGHTDGLSITTQNDGAVVGLQSGTDPFRELAELTHLASHDFAPVPPTDVHEEDIGGDVTSVDHDLLGCYAWISVANDPTKAFELWRLRDNGMTLIPTSVLGPNADPKKNIPGNAYKVRYSPLMDRAFLVTNDTLYILQPGPVIDNNCNPP